MARQQRDLTENKTKLFEVGQKFNKFVHFVNFFKLLNAFRNQKISLKGFDDSDESDMDEEDDETLAKNMNAVEEELLVNRLLLILLSIFMKKFFTEY